MALPTASDNKFPKVIVSEGSTPSSPASGNQSLFIDSSDHKLKRVNSSGTVTTVEGASGAVSTDTIWDAKGDLAAATGADAASKLTVGSNYTGLIADSAQTTGLRWAPGASILLYDYSVAGSDKASIDTGSDTPDAGIAGTSAFPALRLLEFYAIIRTDDAGAVPSVDLILNNDTGSVYDLQNLQGNNATAGASRSVSQAQLRLFAHGSGGSASYAASWSGVFPNYAGTTFYKVGTITVGNNDGTAGNNFIDPYLVNYQSTSAITRLKVAGVSTAKLKVGSRLMIFAR
jgi:hypothetical protein